MYTAKKAKHDAKVAAAAARMRQDDSGTAESSALSLTASTASETIGVLVDTSDGSGPSDIVAPAGGRASQPSDEKYDSLLRAQDLRRQQVGCLQAQLGRHRE